jgi:hypothetical protein
LRISLPALSLERVREEFGFEAADLLDELPDPLRVYREQVGAS